MRRSRSNWSVGQSQRSKTSKTSAALWLGEGKLSPDQEQIIDFGYVVSWPADKKIRIRYGR